MSIESEIARVRSDIYALRSENARLQNEIYAMQNTLSNTVNNVRNAQERAVGALRNGADTINGDDNTLLKVSVVGEEIKQQIKLYKNMENAYKNIRDLKNKLHYNQGNEGKVRRTVTAILDNEKQTFVSDESLREQAEKLHLETKSFFLSYVMMDLVLRKCGETKAADRALNEAVRMNARSTAWVEYLIAVRRGDKKARQKWFGEIEKTPLVGSEKPFLKILLLLALREQTEESDKIFAYTGLDKLKDIDKDETVSSILKKYYAAMTVQPPEFKRIEKHVAEKEELKSALRGAMNNENVFSYIQKVSMRGEDKMRGDVVVNMFDTVIASCHSPEAQAIEKEIRDNEKVIEARGDEAEAMKLKVYEDVTEASDLDVEGCMFEWLGEAEKYNGKRELNEFAYAKYRQSYKRAYKNYVKRYRAQKKETVNITIDEYRTSTNLVDMKKETEDIEKFCTTRRDNEKAAIKDTKFILLTVFGAILLIAGIVLKFISALGSVGQLACFIVGIIGGLALLVSGAVTKYNNYRRKINADERCLRDIIAYRDIMHEIYDDMLNFREMFSQYDEKTIPDSEF